MEVIGRNDRARHGEYRHCGHRRAGARLCEVKRRARQYDALEAVGRTNQESLMRTALDFLLRSAMLKRPVRFDVISVDGKGQVCGHIRDAFEMTL